MRLLLSFLFCTWLAIAQTPQQKQADAMMGYMLIAGFAVTLILFFWGVYKAAKTQQIVYTLAMLPFVLGIIGMFFL